MRSAVPAGGQNTPSAHPDGSDQQPVDLDVTYRDAKEKAVVAFERRYVEALMEWAGGNVSRAARRANMDRMNLYRILQRSGLRSLDE